MSDSLVIDRAVLDDLLVTTGGEWAFVADLIDLYLHDSVAEISRLQEAWATADLDGFRRLAHTLRSTSSSFGATRLARLATELESMARAGSLVGADEIIRSLCDEYARVGTELERLVKVFCLDGSPTGREW